MSKLNWKSEFKKCVRDNTRMYMIENYVLNQPLLCSQKEILYNMKHNKISVISKSRDIGYTSLMAAYIACEMALNCDEDYGMVYVGAQRTMCNEFIRMVITYLERIPKQLWCSDDNLKIYTTGVQITLGKSNVKAVSALDKDIYKLSSDIIENNPKIAVWDESSFMKIDIHCIIENVLKDDCENIVVSGTPNPNNNLWFDFVKKYKESSCYLELPWWTNEKHKMDDYDDVEVLCTPYGEDAHRTNKWSRSRRRMYEDDDAFSIEYDAKVWKYKTIKEYV